VKSDNVFAFVVAFLVVIPAGNLFTDGTNTTSGETSKQQIPCGNDNQKSKSTLYFGHAATHLYSFLTPSPLLLGADST